MGGNVLAANIIEAMLCILQKGLNCESFTLGCLWTATADSDILWTNPPI